MKHISLFSGIGGFDLAAEWAGWDNVASVEIGDFPNKVLEFHFPKALHYRDITKLNYDQVNEEIKKRFGADWRSDGLVLSGGFPCQGFSVAGLRLGTEDDRYLWPEYLRAIDFFQPDWITGENVTGILSMEDKSGVYRDVFAKVDHRKITRFPEIDYYQAIYTRQAKLLVGSICESLEERGYEVQTFAIPAAGVGAPHKRERIWFIAHNAGHSKHHGCDAAEGRRDDTQSSVEAGQHKVWQSEGTNSVQPSDASNTDPRQCQRKEGKVQAGRDTVDGSRKSNVTNATASGLPQSGQTGKRELQTEIGKGLDDRPEQLCADVTDPDNQHGRCESQFGGGDGSGTRDQSEREDNDHDEHANSPGCGQQHFTEITTESRFSCRRHIEDWSNWPAEPPICRGDDGLSERLDGITFSKWRNESIKGFGNALVPQIPFEIFKIIDTLSKT